MKQIENQGEPIVIDACVLAIFAVADLLLLIAERSGLFTPRWTERILEEMHRAHLKFGWGQSAADNFCSCLNPAFPEAQVIDYEPLIEQCTNAVGDRHVLACAIKAGGRRIITANLDDFKPEHWLCGGSRQCILRTSCSNFTRRIERQSGLQLMNRRTNRIQL